MEPDRHISLREITYPDWLCRPEGQSTDGPIDTRRECCFPNLSCATPPCTPPHSQPLFRRETAPSTPVMGHRTQALRMRISGTKSNGTMSYKRLQDVLQKQMSPGLQYQVPYILQVDVGQHGFTRAWHNDLERAAYCRNVYDQKIRVGRAYDATHVISAYALFRPALWSWQTVDKNAPTAVSMRCRGGR